MVAGQSTSRCCSKRHVRRALTWCAVGLLLALPARAGAQPPSADWRVTETPSFRIYYPRPFEAWTLRLAARLESIRARVAQEVGYTPTARTNVIVMDPASAANGAALPILGAPRMVLWTTAPASDSVIGHYGNWGELVAVHEDAHLTHLLRPSRNPLMARLERTLLPIGPITRRSPRWVIEGYATFLEGQITGLGRPHGNMRAAILRRWAQQGQLPPYERLSSDRERWHGMSMAYLAGSAYLEWLVARSDPESLQRLWARMSARTIRTFDDAFRGVFGDSPEALYGRFTAELTARAMEAEARGAGARRDGVLWQRLQRSTGVPALSPDGTKLAVVVHERRRPARLVVYATGPDDEVRQEHRQRMQRMLERDPADHAPVLAEPLPRTELHVLPAINGSEPHAPRWMPDGTSLLHVRYEPDHHGFLHPDIFRWHIGSGTVERLTREAGLVSPDPLPDGRSAVAVRQRHGYSQIVRVDLTTGAVSDITSPSVEIVYDSPRASPDGEHLVYLHTTADGWRAVVRHMRSGTERLLETPRAATLAHPAWSPDGRTIYLSIGTGGFIDIHAFEALEPDAGRPITRTPGAALGAAPVPDGHGLYFLSLEPRGLDLRYVEIGKDAPSASALPVGFAPVVPLEPRPLPEWRVDAVRPGRPASRARQEFFPIAGGAFASSTRAAELGVRGGDLLGRLDYIAVASLAADGRGPAGAALAAAWRGAPVGLGLHVFSADEEAPVHPLRRDGTQAGAPVARRGIELDAVWERHGRPRSMQAGGGFFAGDVTTIAGARLDQQVGFVHGGWSSRRARDRWLAFHAADVRLDAARTAGSGWRRVTALLSAGVGHGARRAVVHVERRALSGAPALADQVLVGGMPSSILPSSVEAGRRHAPALPPAALTGEEHRALRAELSPGTAMFFYERHQVRLRGKTWGGPLTWVGAEVRLSTRPMPLVLLPAADVTAGLARLLDVPAEARFRWWVGVRWKP